MINRAGLVLVASLGILVSSAGGLRAQEGFGFEAVLGYSSMGGDYGKVLDAGLMSEFVALYQYRSYRLGLGVAVASLDFDEDVVEDAYVSKTGFFGHFTYVFRSARKLRPYIQVRAAYARVRPEGEVLEAIDPVEEDEEGENPSDAVDGVDVALVPGIELAFTRWFAVDLSVMFNQFSVGEVDLSPIGQEPVDSGRLYSIRLGAVWRP